jgi:hypothetical protein
MAKRGMSNGVRYGLAMEDRLIKVIDKRSENKRVEEDSIPYSIDENGNRVWSF